MKRADHPLTAQIEKANGAKIMVQQQWYDGKHMRWVWRVPRFRKGAWVVQDSGCPQLLYMNGHGQMAFGASQVDAVRA